MTESFGKVSGKSYRLGQNHRWVGGSIPVWVVVDAVQFEPVSAVETPCLQGN